MLGVADGSLAILFGEEGIHLRHGPKRFDHGVADDVSEGDFSTTGALQVIIDYRSIVDHQLRWNCANTCCSWYR